MTTAINVNNDLLLPVSIVNLSFCFYINTILLSTFISYNLDGTLSNSMIVFWFSQFAYYFDERIG